VTARGADAAAGHPFADRLQHAWATRGPLAIALWPLALLHRCLFALRRQAYAVGLRRSVRLPVPVVVVGNLVVGGAGKTPTVIAVIERLRAMGHRPGIVSRGYGRSGDGLVAVGPDTPARDCGDEPRLLQRRTGAPVVVGRDRVAAARELLRGHPDTSIVVADDGRQHWRLARDLDIVVFDERGIGNGWMLPAGPLREPLPAHVPAATIVLYNAARPSTTLPGSLVRRSLRGIVELRAWQRGEPCRAEALDGLRGRRVIAAAGVARPERFFAMLRERGLDIEPLALPDHAHFEPLPWPPAAIDVIVTEKDAVKIGPSRVGATRVWVAALDFEPDAAFDAALARLVPAPTAHGNPTA
jgi:tetraacyldisaccharide 4'-kinase